MENPNRETFGVMLARIADMKAYEEKAKARDEFISIIKKHPEEGLLTTLLHVAWEGKKEFEPGKYFHQPECLKSEGFRLTFNHRGRLVYTFKQ